MIPEDVARAVELACIVDVMAPKPGNVNRDHDFADTTCESFLVSAWAVAPAFARAHELSVGELILGARRATSRFVSANTNLGIILLLAPFAKAAVQRAPGSLRDRLRRVLDGLTVRDCSLAYAAIREAHPGGLGHIDEHDVSDEPTITLLQAMDVAKSRDSVASEYCSCYELTFELVYPALLEAAADCESWQTAVVQTFLIALAQVPDTLIARKVGWKTAQETSRLAGRTIRSGPPGSCAWRSAVEELDAYLRADGNRRNPGTTADLITAALFVLFAEHGCESLLKKGRDRECASSRLR